jgi:hypothetical protein
VISYRRELAPSEHGNERPSNAGNLLFLSRLRFSCTLFHFRINDSFHCIPFQAKSYYKNVRPRYKQITRPPTEINVSEVKLIRQQRRERGR